MNSTTSHGASGRAKSWRSSCCGTIGAALRRRRGDAPVLEPPGDPAGDHEDRDRDHDANCHGRDAYIQRGRDSGHPGRVALRVDRRLGEDRHVGGDHDRGVAARASRPAVSAGSTRRALGATVRCCSAGGPVDDAVVHDVDRHVRGVDAGVHHRDRRRPLVERTCAGDRPTAAPARSSPSRWSRPARRFGRVETAQGLRHDRHVAVGLHLELVAGARRARAGSRSGDRAQPPICTQLTLPGRRRSARPAARSPSTRAAPARRRSRRPRSCW